MEFTKELLDKAKAAKSAEELLEMAKAENIEVTAEEAKQAFLKLHQSGELADEELDNVSGGCGGEDISEPKYKEDDLVTNSRYFACSTCKCYRAFKVIEVHRSSSGKHTYSIACPVCGERWWNENVDEDSIDPLSKYE